jgi:hypothetical protein
MESVSPMPANKSSISNTSSHEKIGEIWDKYNLTEKEKVVETKME